MHRKNTERYRKVVRLRAVAITVAFAMLFSLLPVYVLAVGAEYLCGHTHDEACNYSISGEGTPCNHICNILSFTDYIPGTAISTYNAQEDDTYESICKALPKVLSGQTACVAGDVDIPVSWSCEDFADEAGTYIFRAELKNKKCAYTVTDDELTGDLDESELPFIAVTVPEPETSVYTLTHATHPVTVSGTDKALDGARLLVKKVELSEVQELLGDDAGSALFAYDIKIMTGGELDEETGEYIGEVEYQPTAENPVKVLITPSEPIDAPVEVIHIAEDEETGEVMPEPVQNVATTKNGAVEFEAKGFSVYIIGTVEVSGVLTLSPGSGYKFYSDADCINEIYGSQEISTAKTIYVKSNSSYIIKSVTVKNADGTDSAVTVSGTAGTEAFTLNFPADLPKNQMITVNTAVDAPGGNISGASTTTQVAAIFDATATTDNTDNVTVIAGGSAFVVTLKNDITLASTITIDSGVRVTIISAGNHTITRDESRCDTHLFSSSGGHLVLGSGNVTDNTITYHFNTGEAETYPVGGTVPVSDTTKYVTYTTVNAVVNSTMEGTLTIDGGAILPDYTGTAYSAQVSGSYSKNDKNLIKFIGGSITMWDGVTLQNNIFAGYDQFGGGAISLSNGIVYMYGGAIRRCVNVCSVNDTQSSNGDGGAMFLQGGSGRLYMYGGTITECESDNSSAISLWNNSSLYLMDGSIHRNYAVGDDTYPPQAMSAYMNASMYIYGGTISDNHSNNTIADVRVSTTGENTLHLFGGTIGSIVANNNEDNTIYVYAGQVSSISAVGDANLIRYSGEVYTVTLPNAVQADGGQTVQVEVYENNDLIEVYASTGIGTTANQNPDLAVQLAVGTYEIVIDSVSMEKTYSVSVTSDSYGITSTSIALTAPELFNRTTNSVTLVSAGTGNSVDGTISYGYSAANGTLPINWQSSTSFAGLVAGEYYFYVRISSDGGLTNTYSDVPLKVTLTPDVSISIGDNVLLSPGGVYIFHPTIIPADYALDSIVWTIEGAVSPDTCVIKNNDGSGTVTIALAEPANSVITICASLAGSDAYSHVAVAVGSVASASMANATVMAGESVSWHMADEEYTYKWQRLVNDNWSDIVGEETDTYTASLSEIGDKIRMVMTKDGISYYSATLTVIENHPIFIITIPETVDMTTTSFNIGSNISGMLLTQNLTVKVAHSGYGYKLKETEGGSTLNYGIYSDAQRQNEILNNTTIAEFFDNGSSVIPIYYTVLNSPIYSGVYTDTLTFTFIYDNGL